MITRRLAIMSRTGANQFAVEGSGWRWSVGDRSGLIQSAPLLPGLQTQAKAVVGHEHVSMLSDDDRLRRDPCHLLGHHAHIGLIAPDMHVAVQPQAILQPAKQSDVPLQPDVGWLRGRRR